MKMVHWPLMGLAVTFGTARRGLGGAPPRWTKCNNPAVNDQSANHRMVSFFAALMCPLKS